MVHRFLITPGEPAGIGPDITIALAQKAWEHEFVAIADPLLLTTRAKELGLRLHIQTCDFSEPPQISPPSTIKVYPIPLAQNVIAGKLNPANSAYVIETLNQAATCCLQKKASAVITGPVNKEVINAANIPFTGHTEFFAQFCKVKQPVMLFVVDELKVALVTTHLPLEKVPAAITKERIHSVLSVLYQELKSRFHIQNPRVLVCGLNPHAGEGGYLGKEEIETITPLLQTWRNENKDIIGPLPADTIFTPNYLKKADAILAMYHDQALPLVKYLGFGHAVNVTLGLPFIRTSVDHGTAIDLAGSGQADAGSMIAATKLAIRLAGLR